MEIEASRVMARESSLTIQKFQHTHTLTLTQIQLFILNLQQYPTK